MAKKITDSDAELIAHNSPAEREERRLQARSAFIDAVADFLVDDATLKSIELQMGERRAKEWARIANCVIGGNSYDNKQQRIEQLTWLLA